LLRCPGSSDPEKTSVRCKHCRDVEFLYNATRMRRHLDLCTIYQKHLERLKQHMGMQVVEDNSQPPVPTLPDTIQRVLEEKAALAIYTTGLPFSIFDSPAVQNLFHALNPGFKLPSRKKLAGSLLNHHVEEMREQVIQKTKREFICMQADGWSDVNNHRIVNLTGICKGKAYLIDSIDTGSMPHNAENVAKWIMKGITDYVGGVSQLK